MSHEMRQVDGAPRVARGPWWATRRAAWRLTARAASTGSALRATMPPAIRAVPSRVVQSALWLLWVPVVGGARHARCGGWCRAGPGRSCWWLRSWAGFLGRWCYRSLVRAGLSRFIGPPLGDRGLPADWCCLGASCRGLDAARSSPTWASSASLGTIELRTAAPAGSARRGAAGGRPDPRRARRSAGPAAAPAHRGHAADHGGLRPVGRIDPGGPAAGTAERRAPADPCHARSGAGAAAAGAGVPRGVPRAAADPRAGASPEPGGHRRRRRSTAEVPSLTLFQLAELPASPVGAARSSCRPAVRTGGSSSACTSWPPRSRGHRGDRGGGPAGASSAQRLEHLYPRHPRPPRSNPQNAGLLCTLEHPARPTVESPESVASRAGATAHRRTPARSRPSEGNPARRERAGAPRVSGETTASGIGSATDAPAPRNHSASGSICWKRRAGGQARSSCRP